MKRLILTLAALALVSLAGCAGYESRISASLSSGKQTVAIDYTIRRLAAPAGLAK